MKIFKQITEFVISLRMNKIYYVQYVLNLLLMLVQLSVDIHFVNSAFKKAY